METIKTYLILILSVALAIMIYFYIDKNNDNSNSVVKTPEVTGTSGYKSTISFDFDPIEEVPVYIKGDTKIIVDKEYKEKYDLAIKEKDSIETRNLFLESISINTFNEVAIDDDFIKIDLSGKTRGLLLGYQVDYTIKEQSYTYTPETIKVRPSLTALLGLELVIPSTGYEDIDMKFNFGLQGKNGNVWSAGIDTKFNKYIGYNKSFTILK